MDVHILPCPKGCQSETTEWLSTTNEWQYYCRHCDVRFNKEGDIYQPLQREDVEA